jgi:hypothetical protein
MKNTDDVVTMWTDRIQTAHRATEESRAVEEQVIRDACATDEFTPSDAARALGTKNRQRVYAILGRSPHGGEPELTPVVYLHGRGRSDATWARVRAAMHARGWATMTTRTEAWHLARGGVPVVLCRFVVPDDPSADDVVVGRVRARWHEYTSYTTPGDLLPTAEQVRLRRAGADWIDTQVTGRFKDMDLELVNGGRRPTPRRYDPTARTVNGSLGCHIIDEHGLARLVAEALAL